MKNLDGFLADGKVERVSVAMAVVAGELTKGEIHELCNDSRMKAAFIGTSYSKKCSKDGWNKEYLDELLCAVAASSFNEDYLHYLYEVAETVRNNEKSRPFVWLVITIKKFFVWLVITIKKILEKFFKPMLLIAIGVLVIAAIMNGQK